MITQNHMGATKKIPTKMLQQMLAMPYYRQCCFHTRFAGKCGVGRLQYHHHLRYGGRRINEIFAILPLCPTIHEAEGNVKIREHLDYIMVTRMTEEDFAKYPNVDWQQKKEYLTEKFNKSPF